jgi:hypothetical protein
MIDDLAGCLVEYRGAPNRARCFTHILNLVVKSIMRQFDLPKKRDAELMNLAGDLEAEELAAQGEQEEPEEGPSLDNDEGWVDEREDMSEEELDELEEHVRPVRILLTKVSSVCTV